MGILLGKKEEKKTDLPTLFSAARYANTIYFLLPNNNTRFLYSAYHFF